MAPLSPPHSHLPTFQGTRRAPLTPGAKRSTTPEEGRHAFLPVHCSVCWGLKLIFHRGGGLASQTQMENRPWAARERLAQTVQDQRSLCCPAASARRLVIKFALGSVSLCPPSRGRANLAEPS